MLQFLFWGKSCVLIGTIFFLIGCGRLTPPKPIEEEEPFSSLKVIQKGNKVRLSWEMDSLLPLEKGRYQFFIEDQILKPYCATCETKPAKTFIIPFPSKHFIISGKQIYYYPQVNKDLNIHVFKVTYQTLDSDNIGNFQSVTFGGFTEFPNPSNLEWKWLSEDVSLSLFQKSEIPDHLDILEVLKLKWKEQVERVELNFSNQGTIKEHEVLYHINIYKTQKGIPWSEKPINNEPVPPFIYFDFQTQCKQIFISGDEKLKIEKIESQENKRKNTPLELTSSDLTRKVIRMDIKDIRVLKQCYYFQYSDRQISEKLSNIRKTEKISSNKSLFSSNEELEFGEDYFSKLEKITLLKKPANGTFLYHIRLVDSDNNESQPSKVYIISPES